MLTIPSVRTSVYAWVCTAQGRFCICMSSTPATLQTVIQDYATLRNNNAVEALIGYN